MSFNGSGTFVINSAGQPVVANTVISATTFNALTSDLANGLSTCITKDGQTTPTANIPMGGFKITNLATGTAATDAATVAQIQSNGAALVTVTGTDTLTGTLTPALVAYVTGAVYYFVAPATNTGAVTLNIDTLGAKAVTRDGTTALVAGDIVSGEMVAVVYDGTRFQLISAVNSFTNLNVSGTLTVAGTTTLNGNLQVGNAAADTVNFQASGWTLTNNVSVIGTWANIGTITTADINGGTIDGTTIGGGTAAAGTFTTVGATTGNITTVNATTVDSTNLEVTNLKAKDGTAAGSVADATGVVTLNSLVATTADINGGTIDATTIGGSSPAVGNFTTVSAASAVFTTATITTVNTTTLDLTNLEVTNIKAKDGTASMTIDDLTGKVNVTTVSAASMNAAVAAITTGSVTNLTATSASVASMNAGVALLTTATVTTLNASGASIASANIGNLQFTAASIASINAGVAVINNLTATSASIASMNGSVASITTVNATTVDATNVEVTNVKAKDGTAAIVIDDLTGKVNATTVSAASVNAGVALITTGTVTNLTSTAASVASANVGVALITTGTVTSLTATGASVASANVGTAVITGLTVTGASIASVNAGTATLSGNLTLNGGTANGVLYLNGSKVATSGSALTFDGTSLSVVGGNATINRSTNATILTLGGSPSANWEGDIRFSTSNTQINWRLASNRVIPGAFTITPSTAAGGETFTTPAFTIDPSSNVGIGTSSPSTIGVSGYTRLVLGAGSASTDGLTIVPSGTGGVQFTDAANVKKGYLQWDASTGALALGTAGTTKATLDSSGNLGLGVSPTNNTLGKSIQNGQASAWVSETGSNRFWLASNWKYDGSDKYLNNGFATLYSQQSGQHQWLTAASGTAGGTISFTQAMTLDADGDLGVGTSSPTYRLTVLTPTSDATVGFNLRAYTTGADGDRTVISRYTSSNDLNWANSKYQAWAYIWETNGTERARITSGGYAKFSNSGSYYGSTGSYHELRSNAAAEYIAQISTSQSTGANCYGIRILYENAAPNGTTNPFWQCQDSTNVRGLLRSNGGLENYSANNVNIASDERLKKDIAPLSSVWGKVKDIEVVNYRYKDCNEGDPLLYGVIAQQVQPIVPDLVVVTREATETEPEYYGIREQPMYWLAIKALQEAMTRIEQLEAKVAALESK